MKYVRSRVCKIMVHCTIFFIQESVKGVSKMLDKKNKKLNVNNIFVKLYIIVVCMYMMYIKK